MKKILFFAAAAVALLTGCSQNDDLTAPTVVQSEQTPIEFGTYMGRQAQTRAGYENTSGMTNDLLQTTATSGGFGVFAYYTGTLTYGQQQHGTYTGESGSASNIAPNFMYNQQVTYDGSAKWVYNPIKYWPNEIQNGAVDAQTGAATTDYTHGGNVSFFAYAPYVEVTQSTAANIDGANPASTAIGYKSSDDDGIIHLSGNNYAGDPIVTYKIPSDINQNGPFVDLLWGTLNGTSQNAVTAGTNTGVEGTGTPGIAGTTYAGTLLDDYFTNADLTKQKVPGTIGFSFKHALATLGGGASNTVGLLAQLDIDDGTNASGGSRETFNTSGSGAANAWRTIVTIKSITITNDLDGSGAINGSEVGLGGTNTFNLATGQWGTATGSDVWSQTIGTADGTNTYNAVLNTKLAEIYDNTPTTWFTHLTGTNKYDYFTYTNAQNASSDHPGVMESPINVYNETTQSSLVLYPGTTPSFKITIDYIVRTYDANLNSQYTEVEQNITKTITFTNPVLLNKKYSILMRLGLTGVKFVATVADWVTDFDNDGNVDDDYELIYLPLNVE